MMRCFVPLCTFVSTKGTLKVICKQTRRMRSGVRVMCLDVNSLFVCSAVMAPLHYCVYRRRLRSGSSFSRAPVTIGG